METGAMTMAITVLPELPVSSELSEAISPVKATGAV
jgi:hypothetical protein